MGCVLVRIGIRRIGIVIEFCMIGSGVTTSNVEVCSKGACAAIHRVVRSRVVVTAVPVV